MSFPNPNTDPLFKAWRDTHSQEMWAKFDLSAARMGFDGAVKLYEDVLADHARLVCELDVLLNGEDGAAKQASLCDIVAQVRQVMHGRIHPAIPILRGDDL